MKETKNWFRRPRYSPLDLTVLLLVATVASAAATHWHIEKKYRGLVREAMTSPLPQVVVARSAAPINADTEDDRYDFSKDWVTRNVPVWEKVLEPFKGQPNISYLEVGAYEGRSVLWMLENILTDPSARVTAIDIFDGPYKEVYIKNIDRSEFGHQITTIAEASQVALRRLPLESFDVIYLDGSHYKADTLEDAVLSWRLLKKGGLMIFDDYRLLGPLTYRDTETSVCPKVAIDSFVQCFADRCEVVHNEYQLIIRKK